VQKILITGGAGFIGSHLCEALVGGGLPVTCLDNFDPFYDPLIKRDNLASLAGRKNFRLVEGDIRNMELLQSLFQGDDAPQIVVHLAAKAGVRPSIEDPLAYQEVNVTGTANLLEMCRRHGVDKFIYASSSSVYGNNSKIPFAEDDPVDHPISPYAATKKAGELLCHTYHHLFGLQVFCLRFFTVYGPRQRPEMAIHKFARLIRDRQPLPVFGDGRSDRDYTYIDDIIDGVTRAIDRCSGYRIFNLGESQTTSLRRLISLIEESMGATALIDHKPMQPGDVMRTYADLTRSREELGYRPSITVDRGIPRFVKWFGSIAC
jgi:UDP-glucuronate 4-epimerase